MNLKSLTPKSLVRRYVNDIKHSIVPKPYSHEVKMNIVVKQGQKSGTALIPCTIYAMDHSIDLNPALIRKTTKEQLTYLDPKDKYRFVEDESIDTYEIKGQQVHYNPNNIVVQVTKDEQKAGYTLNKISLQEYERCPHCAQKVVLAEVNQTRYRSCPEIHVKLADKAKEDTVIPVQFGVNKKDITDYRRSVLAFLGLGLWLTVWLVTMVEPIGWLVNRLIPTPISHATIPVGIATGLVWVFRIGIIAGFWLWIMPRVWYKNFKLQAWYRAVKPHMTRTKYAT